MQQDILLIRFVISKFVFSSYSKNGAFLSNNIEDKNLKNILYNRGIL